MDDLGAEVDRCSRRSFWQSILKRFCMKYDKDNDYQLLQKGTGQEEKAEAAAVFLNR